MYRVIVAISHAADQGVDLVSISGAFLTNPSLGASKSLIGYDLAPPFEAMQAAVDKLRATGALLLASAGNAQQNIDASTCVYWGHIPSGTKYATCAEKVGAQHRVEAGGHTPLDSMLRLCCLGDCASFFVSIITGRDPTPVASIDQLKAELAR